MMVWRATVVLELGLNAHCVGDDVDIVFGQVVPVGCV